jgi:hypothetical protein
MIGLVLKEPCKVVVMQCGMGISLGNDCSEPLILGHPRLAPFITDGSLIEVMVEQVLHLWLPPMIDKALQRWENPFIVFTLFAQLWQA